MRVEVIFHIQTEATSSFHGDVKISKTVEVEWPGRPMPGEYFGLDIGLPVPERDMKVERVGWTIEQPSQGSEPFAQMFVRLESIRVTPEEVEWEGELDGYLEYVQKRGDWKVFDPRTRERATVADES